MGANSAISWTHHTFNPWMGCSKVSPGCANCYAEQRMDKRLGKVQWGPNGTRVKTSESYWRQPLAWNKAAERAGERHRVFCASLADVFEELPHDHPQQPDLAYWRADLWTLIESTPHLDWLLLTKRPENVRGRVPMHWHKRYRPEGVSPEAFTAAAKDWWPANVWIGTSVENQATADERIPHLLQIPARVRFLSCEPLLGAVDLNNIELPGGTYADALNGFNVNGGGLPIHGANGHKVHWVIAGGESGPNARPMHPDWARSLRDQCQAAGVPFHFKQWGEWGPGVEVNGDTKRFTQLLMGGMACGRDGTMTPLVSGDYIRGSGEIIARKGKSAAGRTLDGREWNEFPGVAA